MLLDDPSSDSPDMISALIATPQEARDFQVEILEVQVQTSREVSGLSPASWLLI